MMKPPYIPPIDSQSVSTIKECEYCGGPVDLLISQAYQCRCCLSYGNRPDQMGDPKPPRHISIESPLDISRYLSVMHNGYSIRILKHEVAIELESFANLLKLNQDPRIHVCVLMNRPGATEAVMMVESNTFPPGDDELNDQWDVRVVRWQDLDWHILSFPQGMLDQVKEDFAMCGFCLQLGIPTIVENDTSIYFPIYTPHTYTLFDAPKEIELDIEIEDIEEH